MQKQLLQTLIYADIFDYPLTFSEVKKFLIGTGESRAKVDHKRPFKIYADPGRIDTDGEFYFLKGKEKNVKLRQKREKWSKEKWGIAKKAAEKLKRFPPIKLIGVTGALAMRNCRQEDDIDLLIITSADSLWLTRLLIFLLAPFLGIKRRKPGEQKVKNKICFNLFLEENHLRIAPENLFLAHEILQMKPLLNRGGAYEKFLWENRWVKQYLPNVVSFNNETIEQSNNGLMVSLLHCFIAIFNKMTYFAQRQYMKPKMTVERVNLHQAFFHPHNLQEKILIRYKEKLKSYE